MSNAVAVPEAADEPGRIAPDKLALMVLAAPIFNAMEAWCQTEGVNAWFVVSDFDPNPICVRFDPYALIACHRAGEPVAMIHEHSEISSSEGPMHFSAR